jgi:signal transduction histidine kinase
VLWLSKDRSESVTFAIGTLSPFGAPPLVYGLVLPVAAAGELIRPLAARAPLLPPTLTHGVNLERMVGYRMTSPTGSVLVAAGEAAGSPFAATRVLDSAWGGLRIEVALDQALAGRLVIGGLPRSRLPLVAVLFGLTTVLVATAWVQLRRERELVRQREDFVASVSHELRTPLAQIRLFAETLRLDRVRSADERGRSLEIIDQEARRLSHLVENLLAVSRADRGGLEITPRRLDLMSELRRAVESFQPIAAARTVRLAVDGPDRLDAVVDGEAFRQIVLNLLDNAVKFGPAGQMVGLAMAEVNGAARLTIDDEGPGIPADARERVFERFVRLDREFESGIAGTGLGLALVRELAKLHGGSVVASAAPNGGTRITVELPRDGNDSE